MWAPLERTGMCVLAKPLDPSLSLDLFLGGWGRGARLSLVTWYQGSKPESLAAVGVVRTTV